MEWIKLSDKIPSDGQRVLMVDMIEKGPVRIGYWYESENGFWEDEIGIGWHYTGTYWMPLPEPPKEQS